MKFKIIDNLSNFGAIRDEWNNLLKKCSEPEIFYFNEWIINYLKYYEPSKSNAFFSCIGYNNNESQLLCGGAFLNVDGIIRFVANKGTDYCNILIDKDVNKYTTIRDMVDFLIGNISVKGFELHSFPSSSELYIFEDILNIKGYYTYIREGAITVSYNSTVGYNKKSKSKQLSDIQRRFNKLLKAGKVDIKTSNLLTDEVLDFIMKNKNEAFDDSPLKDSRAMDFYQALYTDILDNAFINTLCFNDTIISAHIGFCAFNKTYYYIPAYDRNYSSYAAGLALLRSMIDNCNTEIFDFLRGNELYKYYWGDKVNKNFSLYAYKRTFRNILLIIYKKIREGLSIVRKKNIQE